MFSDGCDLQIENHCVWTALLSFWSLHTWPFIFSEKVIFLKHLESANPVLLGQLISLDTLRLNGDSYFPSDAQEG